MAPTPWTCCSTWGTAERLQPRSLQVLIVFEPKSSAELRETQGCWKHKSRKMPNVLYGWSAWVGGINRSCAVLESSVSPFLETSDDQENFKDRLRHCQGQPHPRVNPLNFLIVCSRLHLFLILTKKSTWNLRNFILEKKSVESSVLP